MATNGDRPPTQQELQALLDDLRAAPENIRNQELQRYFEKRLAPYWLRIQPEDQEVISEAFGPGVKYPQGPVNKPPDPGFVMSKTKAALKPFLPETKAEDVRDIWNNPHATLGERATVTGAHLLGYPYAGGKAITPDIARGRFNDFGSFFPQGRAVLGAMGEDVGERVAGPLGGMIGNIAGYGASYAGRGGGMLADKIPLLRSLAQGLYNKTLTAPTLAALFRRMRGGAGAVEGAAAPAVEAAPSAARGIAGGSAPVSEPLPPGPPAPRPRARYGPNGFEIYE